MRRHPKEFNLGRHITRFVCGFLPAGYGNNVMTYGFGLPVRPNWRSV